VLTFALALVLTFALALAVRPYFFLVYCIYIKYIQ
jgi:hypothetical protein